MNKKVEVWSIWDYQYKTQKDGAEVMFNRRLFHRLAPSTSCISEGCTVQGYELRRLGG